MTAIRGQPLVRDQVFLTGGGGGGVSDHTLLSNIGVNTHPQIDSHIADLGIHIAAGTSDDNTLRWSGVAWVETDGITIDPVGAVDLEFNSVLALRTTISGISVHPSTGAGDAIISMTDAGGDTFRIEKSDAFAVGVLFNEDDGRGIALQANNISSTPVNMLTTDPDTSVDLFFDGAKAFATDVDGASVFDTTGVDPVLFFFEDDLTTRTGFIQLGAGGNNMHIRSEVHGQSFNIEAEDSGGAVVQLLNADPDGSFDLFFDANLALKTDLDGIVVRDPSGDLPRISFEQDSGTENLFIEGHTSYFRIAGLVDGAFLWITAEDNGGVQRNLIIADPDSAFELFHTGTRVFTSIASGLTMFSPTGNDPIFNMTQDDGFNKNAFIEAHSTNGFRIENEVHGSLFTLAGEDAGGTPRNLFVADPDSDVKLYFAGTQEFATKSGGCIIDDELEIGGALNHDGSTAGFFATTPVSRPTGVAVTDVAIHAALVTLGLITA